MRVRSTAGRCAIRSLLAAAATSVLAAVAAVSGLALLGVTLAPPAGALTPRPTDDRSEVLAVVPAAPVSVRVVGGDTWLELTVAPGHEAVVEGYGGEPYLRIGPDGAVQLNRWSPAASLNRDRDAAVTETDTADTTHSPSAGGAAPTTPDWQPHGSGGRVVWHDHRIHVGEGASLPEPIAWQVPLLVDGQAVVVEGRVQRLDPPSPVVPLVLAVIVGAGLWLIGRRSPGTAAAAASAAASLVAVATGLVEWQSVPSELPRNLGLVVLPAAAAVAAVAGLVLTRRTPRLLALAASVSLLAGWVAFRWSILTEAVLVSSLDPTVDRAALALVLGAVAAAAGLIVTWAGSPTAAGVPSATPSSSG